MKIEEYNKEYSEILFPRNISKYKFYTDICSLFNLVYF